MKPSHSALAFALIMIAASSFTAALGEPPQAPLNPPEQLAKGLYKATASEVVLLSIKTRPEERLAILFTKFAGPIATYRWLYFNPLSHDWVTGVGNVKEMYDKVQTGSGTTVVAVPGHNTQIHAGGVSVEWSRGGADAGWIYFSATHLNLQTLPAAEWEHIPQSAPTPVQNR